MKKITLVSLIVSLTLFVFAQDKIVFDEQFDNNDFGWAIDNFDSYSSSMSDGMYHFNRTAEKNTSYITEKIFIDPKEDFYIETRYKQNSGIVNHGFGLTFGYKDIDNFYTFIVSGNGYFRFSKYEKDVFENLVKWEKFSEETYSFGDYQTLGMRQTDGKWKFYFNDELICETEQRSFYGTELGFTTSNEMSISIDYLTVKQTTNDINLIDNPTNGYMSVNLGENVNTEYNERSPVVSADGKTIYYCQSLNPNNTGGEKRTDIYFTTFENGKWTEKQSIGFPLNNTAHNSVVSVSADNNSLLVKGEYNNDGSFKGSGMSRTYRTEDGWSIPTDVKTMDFQNDGKYSGFYLSPDKNILISSVIRTGDTHGGEDLYVSFKEGDVYTKPMNMGTDINSFDDDFTPFLAADNKTLYFASYGRRGYGSADIYVSRRLDESWTKWSEPENLGPEINTADWDAYLTLSASGESAFLVSGQNSFGSLDIFTIPLPKSARPEPIVLILGQVLDQKTNKPLATEIYYYDLSNGELISTAISDPKTGNYSLTLPAGRKYSFLAMKEAYFPISENLDVLKIDEYQEIERNLYLALIEVDAVIRLNNIFFKTGKSDLQKESYAEINRLVEMLKLNPGMKIEIQGHTDDRGSETSNMNLSEKRAKSVYDYLINTKKMKSSRITYKGYGESIPIKSNKTAAGRTQNRRVEFKIISE